MVSLSKSPLTLILEEAFAEASASNPGVDLSQGRFAARVLATLTKYLPNGSGPNEAVAFIHCHLSTSDLYLATACANGVDQAWARFDQLYSTSISRLAARFADSQDRAEEIADVVRVSLVLPCGSAPSRIGTYDGRSRVSTWLRSVVFNAAAHERDLRYNSFEHLDPLSDWRMGEGASQVEAAFLANKYELIIAETLRLAAEKLAAPDRVLLLLYYEQQVNMRDIATMNRVNVSTVSRRLKRAQTKLGQAIISILASRYLLPQPAINECIQVMLESPNHSILRHIGVPNAKTD